MSTGTASTSTAATPLTASITANQKEERISNKLSTRITNLSSTASKESIQTLTKWILFHINNHPQALSQTISHYVSNQHQHASPAGATAATSLVPSPHLLVSWSIIHELCISHSTLSPGAGNAGKWTSFSSFREAMGETVIRPGLESLRVLLHNAHKNSNSTNDLTMSMLIKVRDNIKGMVLIWQDLNCFDSPTLMIEIKRLVAKVVLEDGTKLDAAAASASSVVPDNLDNPAVGSGITKQKEVVEETMDAISQEAQQQQQQTEEDDDAVEFDTSNADEDMDTSIHDTGAAIETPIASGANTPTAGSDMEDNEEKNDEEMTDIHTNEDSDGDIPKSPSSSPIPVSIPLETGNTNTPMKETPKEKEFDFESQGIAEEKVAVRELNAPCKSIATMQIARDMHNDSSHNLSTVLASVPQAVLDACQEAKEGGGTVELKDLPDIPDDVLDLDLEGALASVRLHREIVEKQKELRSKCIELLIKSRCKFGSAEAAELFYTFDGVDEELKKRKALILDAMELEGLDFEAMDGSRGGAGEEETLQDFPWLTRDDAQNKKLRTE